MKWGCEQRRLLLNSVDTQVMAIGESESVIRCSGRARFACDHQRHDGQKNTISDTATQKMSRGLFNLILHSMLEEPYAPLVRMKASIRAVDNANSPWKLLFITIFRCLKVGRMQVQP